MTPEEELAALRELVSSELLPNYMRLYRLLRVELPLSNKQRALLGLPKTDLCYLVQDKTL